MKIAIMRLWGYPILTKARLPHVDTWHFAGHRCGAAPNCASKSASRPEHGLDTGALKQPASQDNTRNHTALLELQTPTK